VVTQQLARPKPPRGLPPHNLAGRKFGRVEETPGVGEGGERRRPDKAKLQRRFMENWNGINLENGGPNLPFLAEGGQDPGLGAGGGERRRKSHGFLESEFHRVAEEDGAWGGAGGHDGEGGNELSHYLKDRQMEVISLQPEQARGVAKAGKLLDASGSGVLALAGPLTEALPGGRKDPPGMLGRFLLDLPLVGAPHPPPEIEQDNAPGEELLSRVGKEKGASEAPGVQEASGRTGGLGDSAQDVAPSRSEAPRPKSRLYSILRKRNKVAATEGVASQLPGMTSRPSGMTSQAGPGAKSQVALAINFGTESQSEEEEGGIETPGKAPGELGPSEVAEEERDQESPGETTGSQEEQVTAKEIPGERSGLQELAENGPSPVSVSGLRGEDDLVEDNPLGSGQIGLEEEPSSTLAEGVLTRASQGGVGESLPQRVEAESVAGTEPVEQEGGLPKESAGPVEKRRDEMRPGDSELGGKTTAKSNASVDPVPAAGDPCPPAAEEAPPCTENRQKQTEAKAARKGKGGGSSADAKRLTRSSSKSARRALRDRSTPSQPIPNRTRSAGTGTRGSHRRMTQKSEGRWNEKAGSENEAPREKELVRETSGKKASSDIEASEQRMPGEVATTEDAATEPNGGPERLAKSSRGVASADDAIAGVVRAIAEGPEAKLHSAEEDAGPSEQKVANASGERTDSGRKADRQGGKQKRQKKGVAAKGKHLAVCGKESQLLGGGPPGSEGAGLESPEVPGEVPRAEEEENGAVLEKLEAPGDGPQAATEEDDAEMEESQAPGEAIRARKAGRRPGKEKLGKPGEQAPGRDGEGAEGGADCRVLGKNRSAAFISEQDELQIAIFRESGEWLEMSHGDSRKLSVKGDIPKKGPEREMKRAEDPKAEKESAELQDGNSGRVSTGQGREEEKEKEREEQKEKEETRSGRPGKGNSEAAKETAKGSAAANVLPKDGQLENWGVKGDVGSEADPVKQSVEAVPKDVEEGNREVKGLRKKSLPGRGKGLPGGCQKGRAAKTSAASQEGAGREKGGGEMRGDGDSYR
jgi:hypothetical protein